MFIDKASVTIQAGDGGNGIVSWRHEKFIDRGGPEGGDGGKGGSVIFMGSRNQNTLVNFRYQKDLKAEAGGNGGKRRMHGKNGVDLIVPVPVGTAVYNEEGDLIADLVVDGQRIEVARGGIGGFGNAHFVSSVRQAPRIAEKGEEGEAFSARLELKMIADVGLVGLPNAGKSTFLSVVSNATPEIANYPFTTLKPNLGMADVDGEISLLIADIPGLIEGAAEGKGLGDDFLRHVERTAVLLHLVDAYQDDVAATYQTIQNELKAYKIDLSQKPQVVALTKIEGLDDDIVADLLEQLRAVIPEGTPLLAVSAHTHVGIPQLLRQLRITVEAERQKQADDLAQAQSDLDEAEANGLPILRLKNDDTKWQVVKTKHGFLVSGAKIERFAGRTDFENEATVARLRDIMKRMGILHELVRQGINPGDTIAIAKKGVITY